MYDNNLADPDMRGETPAVYNWLSYVGTRGVVLLGAFGYACKSIRHCGTVGEFCGFTALEGTLLHEIAHVDQVVQYNAAHNPGTLEPYYSPDPTRTIDSDSDVCPTPPCGWAFVDHGRDVLTCDGPPWNRFQDVSGGGFNGFRPPGASCVCLPDVCLDADEDTIPDNEDDDDIRDTFEQFAWLHEPCDPEGLKPVDWGCPGCNAQRAPYGSLSPCY